MAVRSKVQKFKPSQKKIFKAWENFVLHNRRKSHDLPVVQDWEICVNLGVDPWEIKYKNVLSKQELEDRIIRRAELIEVCRPHLDIIEETIRTQTTTYAIVLADEEGYCIDMRCDNQVGVEDNEEAYTRLGGCCTERDMGNNGIGTVLRTKKPVAVEGAEHYNRKYHRWTDVGAPILDLNRQLIGVLSIAIINEYASPYTLSMTVATAKAIETELLGKSYREKILEKNNALSILEQKYEFVLNSLKRGALVANNDYIVTYCNNSAAEIMRAKVENVIGKHLKEIFILPEHNRVISNTLAKGVGVKNYSVATRCLGTDIKIVIDTDLVYDNEKNIIGVVAIFDDLLEMKKTEEIRQQLILERTLTESILNKLPVGMIITNNAGNTFLNKYTCELLGYRQEEIKDLTFDEIGMLITPEGGNPCSISGISNSLVYKGQPELNYIKTLKNKKGILQDFSFNTQVLFDDKNMQIGIMTLFSALGDSQKYFKDITDRFNGVEVETREGLKLRVKWKNIRHEWAMEKKEFALKVLKIHPNQYYGYENGVKIPTLPNALKLAGVLQKDIEDIYSITE